jgi:hypothetical protein
LWKKRYVVLTNGSIRYYKIDKQNEESFVLRGEVPIDAHTSLVRNGHGESEGLPKFMRRDSGPRSELLMSKSCQFALCGLKPTGAPYFFKLVAESSEDREAWCDAIQVTPFYPFSFTYCDHFILDT